MLRTFLNLEYIDEVWHIMRLKNQTELFKRAKLGGGYGSKLRERPRTDVRLSTVDRLAEAIAQRLEEIGAVVPDDLWNRLIVRVEVAETDDA